MFINTEFIKPLKKERFWLLAIAVTFVAIHLTLTIKTNSINLLSSSLLFWFVVCSLIWDRRDDLVLESSIIPSISGTAILAMFLIKSHSITAGHFLNISPLFIGIGLALIASGFPGIKQYSQELICLFFIDGSYLLLSSLIDISPITAKFAAFFLWYSGFNVFLIGVNINLPHGGVIVDTGCSGLESITYLLGIAVLVFAMFSITGVKKLLLLLVAVLLGFVVNVLRVCLMAILVESSHPEAFDYWHTGQGSLIFSLFSVLIFGLFCMLILSKSKQKNQIEEHT